MHARTLCRNHRSLCSVGAAPPYRPVQSVAPPPRPKGSDRARGRPARSVSLRWRCMGPGGPRGLQNRCGAMVIVLGGFDSHALPPVHVDRVPEMSLLGLTTSRGRRHHLTAREPHSWESAASGGRSDEGGDDARAAFSATPSAQRGPAPLAGLILLWLRWPLLSSTAPPAVPRTADSGSGGCVDGLWSHARGQEPGIRRSGRSLLGSSPAALRTPG